MENMKKHEKFKKHEKYARHKMLQVKLSSCEVSAYDHMTVGAENKFKEKPSYTDCIHSVLSYDSEKHCPIRKLW